MLQVKETEFESLFAQELFKYNDLSGTIKSTFTDQATLLTQIQAENDSFLKQRSSNAQLESRQKVLQQYENAYKTFVELKGHLKDGINFYTKFQEHLTKFKIKCSDFAFARKTEKSDLLAYVGTQYLSIYFQHRSVNNHRVSSDLQAQAAGLATAQAHSSPSQLSQSHTHSMSPLAGSAFASPLAAPNLYTQAHPVYQQQQQGPPPYVAAPAQNLAGTFVMQGQQYTHQPQQYNQQSFYAASPQPGMVPGPYMQHPQQQLQQQPPPGYHVVYPGNQPAPGY
jgi:programmed cell death 6-interacting protein